MKSRIDAVFPIIWMILSHVCAFITAAKLCEMGRNDSYGEWGEWFTVVAFLLFTIALAVITKNKIYDYIVIKKESELHDEWEASIRVNSTLNKINDQLEKQIKEKEDKLRNIRDQSPRKPSK